jgi:hypothetical protein
MYSKVRYLIIILGNLKRFNQPPDRWTYAASAATALGLAKPCGFDPFSSIAQGQRPGKTIQISQVFKVGFPIRKSMDQSSFAAPHGLSQRITSFIACACQGIHQLPLFHLIVLIANAHP